MNCDRVRETIPLYLADELKGEDLAAMQRHLQECRHCGRAVQADRELDDALRAAVLEPALDVSAVLQRVHAGMAAPWWRRNPRLVSLSLAGLVAATIIIMLVGLPRLYFRQAQRLVAQAAAEDHYRDLVMLRHPDWSHQPDEVALFMQRQFPQKPDLLQAITPARASFEKVRLCNVGGVSYAHFVFRMGAGETSVFLRADPEGRSPVRAAHLSGDEHGLEVSGFSSSGLAGIVVGHQGEVPTLEIARRLAGSL